MTQSQEAKKPVHVAVTGATGRIGYALVFHIASGRAFGPDQPVVLQLWCRNTPESVQRLQGVVMELVDCAFPLLTQVKTTVDAREAFEGAEAIFLAGAATGKVVTCRADLLKVNEAIFHDYGVALNEAAPLNTHVLVIGNPCNTNAFIARRAAPRLPDTAFSALMRTDHNRCMAYLAHEFQVPVSAIENCVVWGNHNLTMFPDLECCTVNGQNVFERVSREWYEETFIPYIRIRGDQVYQIKGATAFASPAIAAINQMHDWFLGTEGRVVTMAVASDGSYGIPPGFISGLPVRCRGGSFEIVHDWPINEFARRNIQSTVNDMWFEAHKVKLV